MGHKNSTLSLVAPMGQTRIVVADPHPVILHGMRKMLEDDHRFQVVAAASTLQSFQKKVLLERPDVALLDWCMASRDMKTAMALLRPDLRRTSIIFLTVSENSQQKQDMLRLGAEAFLSKWCSAGKLRRAVSKACRRPLPQERSAAGPGSAAPSMKDLTRRIEELTQRELQLLPLVCRGLKNKEIALQLGIAESTVWHHLTAIFKKLRVGDRLGLAAFAYSHRLVSPAAQSHQAPSVAELHPSRVLKYTPAADRSSQREHTLNA